MVITYPTPEPTPRTSEPVSETNPLPSTLNGLLSISITDARALDREAYHPYGGHWHTARENHPCQVCLAGCLIARALDNPSTRSITPDMFSSATEQKLEIVDYMRAGEWLSAFKLLYIDAPDDEITSLIRHLPHPFYSYFHGWTDFDAHLNSLDSLLPMLRAIDDRASESGHLSFDHRP